MCELPAYVDKRETKCQSQLFCLEGTFGRDLSCPRNINNDVERNTRRLDNQRFQRYYYIFSVHAFHFFLFGSILPKYAKERERKRER